MGLQLAKLKISFLCHFQTTSYPQPEKLPVIATATTAESHAAESADDQLMLPPRDDLPAVFQQEQNKDDLVEYNASGSICQPMLLPPTPVKVCSSIRRYASAFSL
jgi:hypothetical protein